jgi:hypothetical protein
VKKLNWMTIGLIGAAGYLVYRALQLSKTKTGVGYPGDLESGYCKQMGMAWNGMTCVPAQKNIVIRKTRTSAAPQFSQQLPFSPSMLTQIGRGLPQRGYPFGKQQYPYASSYMPTAQAILQQYIPAAYDYYGQGPDVYGSQDYWATGASQQATPEGQMIQEGPMDWLF